MKPGRWKQRDGRTAIVRFEQLRHHWPWKGSDADGNTNSWDDDGLCYYRPDDLDLIEYLGPLKGST